MNLNKNLRSEKNINDISPTSEKTSFGKLYALILSVLLIVMCIGQFFFPVIKINSSSDKNIRIPVSTECGFHFPLKK